MSTTSFSNFRSGTQEEGEKRKLIKEDDVLLDELDDKNLTVPPRSSVGFTDENKVTADAKSTGERPLTRRVSDWSRAPGEAQKKRRKQLKSLLNATAFPLFMAILVTVIKDGHTYTFYITLMVQLFLGLALQIGIAIGIVLRNGIADRENPLDIGDVVVLERLQIEKLKARFDLWLEIATTLSIALNLSVNATFAARTVVDGGTSTGNGTK